VRVMRSEMLPDQRPVTSTAPRIDVSWRYQERTRATGVSELSRTMRSSVCARRSGWEKKTWTSCSVDKAKEICMDWWSQDSAFRRLTDKDSWSPTKLAAAGSVSSGRS